MSRTITATVPAWLTGSYGPSDLLSEDQERVISSLVYSTTDMSGNGWSKCGTAEITVSISGERELIDNKVASLKAEKLRVLGKAHREAEMIESQIQQLLCIEYKPDAGE